MDMLDLDYFKLKIGYEFAVRNIGYYLIHPKILDHIYMKGSKRIVFNTKTFYMGQNTKISSELPVSKMVP